jgi:hypothetical protein
MVKGQSASALQHNLYPISYLTFYFELYFKIVHLFTLFSGDDFRITQVCLASAV